MGKYDDARIKTFHECEVDNLVFLLLTWVWLFEKASLEERSSAFSIKLVNAVSMDVKDMLSRSSLNSFTTVNDISDFLEKIKSGGVDVNKEEFVEFKKLINRLELNY